jgi:hypothetical protein
VGTFEIVLQSSQLNVADKCISSPVYITKHRKEEIVPDHQFHFFTNEGMQKDSFMQDFFLFGERMKRRIQNSPFYWKGFGTLHYASNEMLFEPDEIRLEALQPIPAQKVLRENVQHNMLVGDQEMTSQQVTEALNKVEYKRPLFIIVGWVLFALAAIAILIYLYMKNFQTTSTGLQTKW